MRNRLLYAGFGVLATVVGMAAGHLVASLLDPASSPVLAVGSTVIDLTPTPVKEWAVAAVRHQGQADPGRVGAARRARAGRDRRDPGPAPVRPRCRTAAAPGGGGRCCRAEPADRGRRRRGCPPLRPGSSASRRCGGSATAWARPDGSRRARPAWGCGATTKGPVAAGSWSPPACSRRPPRSWAAPAAGSPASAPRRPTSRCPPRPTRRPSFPTGTGRQGRRHQRLPDSQQRLLPGRHPAQPAGRQRRRLHAHHRRRRRQGAHVHLRRAARRCR